MAERWMKNRETGAIFPYNEAHLKDKTRPELVACDEKGRVAGKPDDVVPPAAAAPADVAAPAGEGQPAPADAPLDVEAMSMEELRDMADGLGIDAPPQWSRAKLVEAIKEKRK